MSDTSLIRPATAINAQEADSGWLIFSAGSAAFITYVCMYAFRRPFTAATFETIPDWGQVLDFKTTLLVAQVAGYALSKFIGIKVVSEMLPERRGVTLLGLVLLSWVALAFLPILPVQLKFIALFANGLPLGMVWGLVFSFIEGRKITEAAGAILCVTFVLGSGLVKSVGSWLVVDQGISELWMPFCTAALFLLPFMAGVRMLNRLPPPTAEDIQLRQRRIPLDKKARWQFFGEYWLGITTLVLVYMLLTALRDFSDNFAAEIWTALGYGDTPEIFLFTSIPISLLVLALLGTLMRIRNNQRALHINQCIIGLGFLIVLGGTWLFDLQVINGIVWFVTITVGLYLSYVPFNCILFERLVAATRNLGNAGFLIYLADSFGYLGSVGVMLYKSIFQPELSWIGFTVTGSYFIGAAGVALTLISMWYFKQKLHQEHEQTGYQVARVIP